MGRTIATTILIIICYVLQTTLFKFCELAGVVPNLLLVVTAFAGYLNGSNHGIATGVFCGLLIDCQFGSVIGIYTLIYMLIGYITGMLTQLFFKDDYTLPLGIITLSSLFYGIVSYAVEFLLRGRLEFSYYFSNVIMPGLVYTVVVSIFLYVIQLKAYKFADKVQGGGMDI